VGDKDDGDWSSSIGGSSDQKLGGGGEKQWIALVQLGQNSTSRNTSRNCGVGSRGRGAINYFDGKCCI